LDCGLQEDFGFALTSKTSSVNFFELKEQGNEIAQDSCFGAKRNRPHDYSCIQSKRQLRRFKPISNPSRPLL
jgi:hypothetical protein